MNRKLHNTFLGLTASTAMLSLALALGAPVAQPDPLQDALSSAIELEVRLALAEAGIAVDEAEHAAAAARSATASLLRASGSQGGDDGHRRRSRQSLVVPYFSFAPRG